VLSADCLPVLFCNFEGTLVAAAHAGWRGLAGGVLEATVAALPVPASELMAWLGPAIGADAYEVGPEVRAAFLAAAEPGGLPSESTLANAFAPSKSRDGHFYADLYRLARLRLAAAGVVDIHGGNHCTFTDESRFFSHRRDGQTGRMASLICINPA
jgi:YfiH family protein